MPEDRQVLKLCKLLVAGCSLSQAAMRTGMDEKTARKYRQSGKLPSESREPHTWQTRQDPFVDVWSEVEEQLELNPGLQAKTLFEWLQREHAGRFQDGQLRTLQRKIKRWRALAGPPKEVFFSQVHTPGRLGASDFTHMASLAVTIAGQPFEHMLYHFVLTYSNWESATICFSESFESLSEGLQNALWELGGVPERHRTDRLSAAVNNLSNEAEFTSRYTALMQHYSLLSEKTQAGHGNENGDAESLHRHFKDAVDQALMLRGSRDFAGREQYADFLGQLLRQKNAGRVQRLAEERAALRPLPSQRRESCKRKWVRVNSGSLIQVDRNTYSVDSRLIGEQVDVRLYADELVLWYGQREVDRLPRLRGRQKSLINYRHVIDWLVRKPGAFENYRYQSSLFPTSRFRMAYDALRAQHPARSSREYLEILHLAARENESAVDAALRVLQGREELVLAADIKAHLRAGNDSRPETQVTVDAADLSCFDALLPNKEVWDGDDDRGAGVLAEGVAGTASADVSRELCGSGPLGGG